MDRAYLRILFFHLVFSSIVSISSSCSLLSPQTQAELIKLQRDAGELIQKIGNEQNPVIKKDHEAELSAIQKKMGEALRKLTDEGKKIDVKAILDKLHDAAENDN